MKIKQKKGISLIVLVITIIVMIILAAAIILSLNSSGIIGKANKAKEESDRANLLEAANVAAVEWELEERLNNIEEDKLTYIKNKLAEQGFSETLIAKVQLDSNGNITLGLNDDRLNNEEIVISSKEELYALGRLLLDENIQTSVFSTYTTDGKLTEDLNLFEIPDKYVTDTEKIEYLRTTSYRLENDITIKFNRESNYDTYFVGIGGKTKSFNGFFNGNGKNINIEGSEIALNSYYETLSVFGYVDDAVITNININLNENISISYNVRPLCCGLLAGNIIDTTIYNNNITIDGGSLGVNYKEGTQYYNDVYMSTMIGMASNNCKIENCDINLLNEAEIYIKHNDDTKENVYNSGLIVAKTEGDVESRVIIDNCNVNMENSKCYMIIPDVATIAGVVGYSKYTDILNSNVVLENSKIGIEAIDNTNHLDEYYSVAVGGIIGYSFSGSRNTDYIGYIGSRVDSCSFKTENSTQDEVLYAKIAKGGSPNVGGIIGQTFNNGIINNCDVELKNAILISQREEEDTEEAAYGATTGGIVGRLEHTGQIKGCNVNSNNSKIIARSTGKEIYCGGIVGVDMGPYHRNVKSLENNKYSGNNTSSLELEVISGEQSNKLIGIGGLAGTSAYIAKNCKISGTEINFKGATDEITASYIGKLIGRFNFESYGLWNSGTYFNPDTERGAINCTINNVTINVEGDGASKVFKGEIYAISY